eukprot:15462508-Alexandrium_andersonii.AAC.1
MLSNVFCAFRLRLKAPKTHEKRANSSSQTDRQTDRQTGRQADRQTDRQTAAELKNMHTATLGVRPWAFSFTLIHAARAGRAQAAYAHIEMFMRRKRTDIWDTLGAGWGGGD